MLDAAAAGWGAASERTNTSATVCGGTFSQCAFCDPSVVPVFLAGKGDWRRDRRLVEVDASGPVGHVSGGSTFSGSAQMKVIPFFGCRSVSLESFGGDALAADGDLPAYRSPACFEKDMVHPKARLFLLLLCKFGLFRGSIVSSEWFGGKVGALGVKVAVKPNATSY